MDLNDTLRHKRAKDLQRKTVGMFADRVYVHDIGKTSADDLIKTVAGDDPRRRELARELLAIPDGFSEDETHH